MRKLIVRPVRENDTEDLARIYAELDSCNARPSQTSSIIQATQKSLEGELNDLTLVAEDPSSGQILGSGRLIKQTGIQMYSPSQNGLTLTQHEDEFVEFASMIVPALERGQGIGKTISIVRSFLAKLFDTEKILAEFLPSYESPDGYNNQFWSELILPQLKVNGVLSQLKAECSFYLDRKIQSDQDLLYALVHDLSGKQRNKLVAEYFPIHLNLQNSDFQGTVGESTKAAIHNLREIYGKSFKLTGFFPIDGGQNYTAPTEAIRPKAYSENSILFTPNKLSFEVKSKIKVHKTIPSPEYGIQL